MFIHVYISGLVDSTCRPQCKPVLFILARYHGGVGPTVEYLWSVGVTRGPHFSRDSDQITNDPSSGPTQIKSPRFVAYSNYMLTYVHCFYDIIIAFVMKR